MISYAYTLFLVICVAFWGNLHVHFILKNPMAEMHYSHLVVLMASQGWQLVTVCRLYGGYRGKSFYLINCVGLSNFELMHASSCIVFDWKVCKFTN